MEDSLSVYLGSQASTFLCRTGSFFKEHPDISECPVLTLAHATRNITCHRKGPVPSAKPSSANEAMSFAPNATTPWNVRCALHSHAWPFLGFPPRGLGHCSRPDPVPSSQKALSVIVPTGPFRDATISICVVLHQPWGTGIPVRLAVLQGSLQVIKCGAAREQEEKVPAARRTHGPEEEWVGSILKEILLLHFP